MKGWRDSNYDSDTDILVGRKVKADNLTQKEQPKSFRKQPQSGSLTHSEIRVNNFYHDWLIFQGAVY